MKTFIIRPVRTKSGTLYSLSLDNKGHSLMVVSKLYRRAADAARMAAAYQPGIFGQARIGQARTAF